MRGLLVKRKLSDVEVRLGSGAVRAGRELPVSLSFQARKPVEIERISVVLKGWEQVGGEDSGGSGHRSTGPWKKHILYEQEWLWPVVQGRVPARFPVQVAEKIRIPHDAPASLHFGRMQIAWRLELQIAMVGSPDWSDI